MIQRSGRGLALALLAFACNGCDFKGGGVFQRSGTLALGEQTSPATIPSSKPGAPGGTPTPTTALLVDSFTLSTARRTDFKSAVGRVPLNGSAGIPNSTLSYRDFRRLGTSLVYTSGMGLSVSNDGGASWILRNGRNGLDGAVHSAAELGNALFVGGTNGLYVSRDGGLDFTKVALPPTLPTALAPTIGAVRASATTILASSTLAGSEGLFASVDNGATFQFRPVASMPGICGRVNRLAVSGTRFIASCMAITGTAYAGGIAYSDDGGKTWTPSVLPADAFPAYTQHSLEVSGDNVYFGAYGQFLASSNRGVSFVSRVVDPNFFVIKSIAIANGKLIVGGSGTGIELSEDGGVTFKRFNPIGDTVYGDFATANGNEIILSASGGIGATSDGGRTYTPRVNFGNAGTFAPSQLLVSGANFYAGTSLGLGISTDAGLTMKQASVAVDSASNTIRTVALSGARFIVATGNGLYWSDNFVPADATRVWTRRGFANGLVDDDLYCAGGADTFVIAGGVGGFSISSNSGNTFATTPTPGGATVYRFQVGGLVQNYATNAGLYRTTNGGVSYVLQTTASGVGLPSNTVYDVKDVAGKTYVLTSAGFATSVNSGASWTAPTVFRKGQAIAMAALGAVHGVTAFGNRVYVGTQFGLAYSTDNGVTFNILSGDGLGEGPYDAAIIDVASDATSLFFATQRGIFKLFRDP